MAEADEADAWAVGVGQGPWQDQAHFIIVREEWGQGMKIMMHTNNAE